MDRINQIKGDLRGGINSAILNIFQCIPFGLIAFAPLGSEYENFGIMACIIASVLAGFLASFFGGSPGQITGPGAAVCLVFSYIITYLMDIHLFDSQSPTYIPSLLALTFFTVFLSGMIQLLFGLFKADYLIKFISYPVIAGIATGTGIVIMFNALWKLLGIAHQTDFTILNSIKEVKFGSFIIGIATALLLWFRAPFLKGILGFPLSIMIGTGIYYLLLGMGVNKESLGETFEKFTFAIPYQHTSLSLFTDTQIFKYLSKVYPLAINLSILCSLQSLLSVLALKNYTQKEANSRKELIGQGIGNMASGLFGGLPSCGTFSRSILNFQEGGRTNFSGMICALATLVFALLFSSLIEYLPKAVIGGVVLILGLRAIDKWALYLFYQVITRKIPFSKELLLNIGIILTVMILIFSGNFIPAIGVGVLISILVFLGKMRSSLIKRIYESQSIPRKNIDDEKMMKFLSEHHQDIKVIELGGMIYFGSAEKLSDEILNLAKNNTSYIILDMKKVDDIDLTGARVLEQTYETLKKQNQYLGFSGLKKGSPVWQFFESIHTFDKIDPALIFPNTDRALEYFEDLLLKKNRQHEISVALELTDFPVFQNMTPAEIEILKSFLIPVTYKKGEILFKEGELGDAMYFIQKGTIDILISTDQRIQSLTAGTFFGEIALLQKGKRSATVVASSDLSCYRLTKEHFNDLVLGYSHLSTTFLMNMSKILSNRITFINQLFSEMQH